MKHRCRLTVVFALLLHCTTAVAMRAECRSSESSEVFSVSAYYVHWLRLTTRALSVQDVIAEAERNRSVLHFRSEMYGVGPRLDSILRASKGNSDTRCDSGGFDCRTVYIVRKQRQFDTVAFSRCSSCMLVNDQSVPVDLTLLKQLAENLPWWQADFIFRDMLPRRE